MTRSIFAFVLFLSFSMTSCGPSAKDVADKRFTDSIVRADSLAQLVAEQNRIPDAEKIKSLIVGKWVLDSSTSTPVIPEQKDPKYLKDKGRVRPDGQVVLYSQKSFVNKEDYYQSHEYKNDGQLITHLIYNAGTGNKKHYDQEDEYSYDVKDSTITYWFILKNGRRVEFKSIVRKLTSSQLYYRGEDAGSTDQLFYFSKIQ